MARSSQVGPVGFSILADPTSPVADIVFVHGLMGDPELTWTYDEGSTKAFWPKDFLCKDIRNARILTYGYEADPKGANQNTLIAHGENMAGRLAGERKGCENRPIIFVAHSLGGLLVKELLLLSKGAEPGSENWSILPATYKIIFLGTPHRGSHLASLGGIVAAIGSAFVPINRNLLEILKTSNSQLEFSRNEFNKLLWSRRPKAFCFMEGRETKTSILSSSMVVPRESASLSFDGAQMTIDADHASMCKFAKKTDQAYKDVSREIKSGIDSILTETQKDDQELSGEREECLKTLSFVGMGSRPVGEPYESTLEWVSNYTVPTLQRLIDGSLPMIVVFGKPGSGKSVLSKYLVRHFTPPPAQHPRGEAIASFFFSDRGSKHQKSVQGFLQSLVHQILNQIRPLFRHILPTYHDVKNNGGEIWSTETLKQVLISMITDPHVKSIRLVIDAFDECDAEDELLDLIFRDLIKPQSRVQVLITSRPNNALDQEIKDDQKIVLEDLNGGDIGNYIEKVLEDLKQSPKSQHYASAMGDFRELLISQPRGVFLWAKLAIEELKKRMRNGSTVPDLKKMLGGLPGDLGGFYGHMFQNIVNANVESEARKILIWVLYAERPLTLEEIRYASAISTPDFSPSSFAEIESSGHLKTPEMMERSLRSICGGFLEVKPISPNGPAINTEDNTGSNRFVQLIHQSAKEFLLKKKFPESPSTPNPPLWITPYDAHDHILQTCIAYLTLSDLEPWKQDCFLPFQEYTAYKWVNHARLIDRSGEKSYLEKLEKPEREEYRRFLSYIENGEEGAYNSPLTLASTIGLLGDVKRLLAKNKYGEEVLGDALNAAATYNHEGIVDLLISKGANINFSWGKNPEKMTTLQTAIFKGQKSMTQSLIEKGADVKLEGGKYGTALQVAAYVGDLELVELFTKMGADVNAEGGKFWTALQAAATSGYGEVVKLLIEKGANVNATGGEYGTALQAAAYGGNGEIMQHLITNNADIKVVGGEFGTLLQAAAFWGNEGSVKTLISNGADVNAVGGRYGTALQAAVYGAHENIMRILIDNGADTKIVGGEYGTLLQTAASRGAEEIVKFLIDSGADVDVIGGYYGTALQAAAECGHEGIVGSLCDKGADVNLIAGHYGTALQAAAFFGHQGTTTFLISKGANVNAKGGYYGTALQAAAYGGYEEVLQLLIHSGADVDAVGGEFGTALQAAAFQGYEQVVRFLVDDCKAKLDLMGGNFGTALQAAMAARRSTIVDLLTQKAAEESK